MAMNNTMNIAEAAELLRLYVLANVPAFLWGAPGVGKSEVTFQLKEALSRETKENWGLIDFRASLRDPVDLKGMPFANPKTMSTDFLIPGELPNEKRDGKRGILFMDELPLATQAMMGACFGLVLDRRVANYVLPDGWVIVAAGNRQQDRSGANRLPDALKNRFAHITVEVDYPAWLDWAVANDIHPAMIAFQRFRQADRLLHRPPTSNDQLAFPTPRSWVKAAKFTDAPAKLRRAAFEGIVGEGAAAEYAGFLTMWKDMPSLDDIEVNPDSVHVPDMSRPGALYAVSAAIARRANKTNFANICKYAKRLPAEFEAMTVTDAVRRDPSLKSTKAFIDFGVRHQEIVT